LWFPQRNFRVFYSSHSGVTCPPTSAAVGSALFGMLDGTKIYRLPEGEDGFEGTEPELRSSA
jgi:hypothetical protein